MTETTRPVILVTYAMDDPAASEWLRAYLHTLADGATTALRAAGADVRVVDAASVSDSADALLKDVDGLLILGGGDIDPALYGQQPTTSKLYGVNARTDRLEIALASTAMGERMPLLGICRGLQVLNVAAGGTIVQHLGPGQHSGTSDNSTMTDHDVSLVPGSRLAALYPQGELRIRSGHHQAVDRVGEGLRVTAISDDGVIEALESIEPLESAQSWVVGVQWHPEDPDADAGDLAALMTEFVAQCNASAEARHSRGATASA